jgi:HPt (histidine-containing phosphotransfer) domain-containing protein/PAS domain-containing protein
MLMRGNGESRRSGLPAGAPGVIARIGAVIAGALVIATLTWLWNKTQSVIPEEHARIDSALRELRSLDRTVNQDVLQARYQLIDSYEPVLRSYRRIQELETTVATPPRYLDDDSRKRLTIAMADYRGAVTAKQRLIEEFKYRTLNLKDLLAYLPGAGTGVAKAARASSEERLAADVNRALQQMLLYNLTSDDKYATVINSEIDALEIAGRKAPSYLVKRRVRTLVLNIRTLLRVKPEVDKNLRRIFEQPVTAHEETVAAIYYAGYSAAERTAGNYRVLLYALCIALIALVAYSVRRLQRTARALAISKEELEERVVERTRELGQRNGQLRAVLDNVDQALFAVDLDGRISDERSASLERWFPGTATGTHLWTLLEAVNRDVADWAAVAWEQLSEGALPLEVALDQLPRKLSFAGHHYKIGYRPITGAAGLERVLVVISNVTEAVELERSEIDQREQLAIFQQLMGGRAEFLEFFAECDRLARSVLAEPPIDRPSLLRAVHTLKGNCSMRGLGSIVSVCHALEEKLSQPAEELEAKDRTSLATAWAACETRVRRLTGTIAEDRVELTRADLTAVREGLVAGKSVEEILQILRRVEREPAAHRLERIADDARSLAQRLGKGDLVVTTEADDIRFERKRWAPFWAAFVHTIRNAVDHGVESGEERVANGKPRAGHLSLRARQNEDNVIIEISDDGRGIDWAAVGARARDLGREADTKADLLAALSRGGISTKASTTEFSGRGAGVSACYAACASLGGSVSVNSTPGRGTTFEFRIPADKTVSASIKSAA